MVLIENHGLVLALHIFYCYYVFVLLLLHLYFIIVFCVFCFLLFLLYIDDYVLLQLFGSSCCSTFLFLLSFYIPFVEPSLCIELPIYTHSYLIVLLSSYCSS